MLSTTALVAEVLPLPLSPRLLPPPCTWDFSLSKELDNPSSITLSLPKITKISHKCYYQSFEKFLKQKLRLCYICFKILRHKKKKKKVVNWIRMVPHEWLVKFSVFFRFGCVCSLLFSLLLCLFIFIRQVIVNITPHNSAFIHNNFVKAIMKKMPNLRRWERIWIIFDNDQRIWIIFNNE